MFTGLPTLVFIVLVLPAALLFAAILYARRTRPDAVRSVTPALIITATYPIWMFVWCSAVLVLGGMVGPCASAPATPFAYGLFIVPPSIALAAALRWSFQSTLMLAAPLAASATLLVLQQIIGSKEILDAGNSYWPPYLWIAIVIGTGVWHLAITRRPIPGRCTRCGYSLLELPTSTRCPECGTPFSAS